MNRINERINVRKSKKSDPVEPIARCLYLTDPYIYPQISGSAEDPLWIDYVTRSFRKSGALFGRENLIVAETEGRIVGVCCLIRGGVRYASMLPEAEICPSPAFQKVKQGYFDPLILENLSLAGRNLTNLCVLPAFRGRGVGRAMLDRIIALYGKEDLHLDVLAENAAAIALYEAAGFFVTSGYDGFGIDGTVPCLHMLRPGE